MISIGRLAKVEQGVHSGRIGKVTALVIVQAGTQVVLETADGPISVPERALYPSISGAENDGGRHRK